jgi:hypothetical protein
MALVRRSKRRQQLGGAVEKLKLDQKKSKNPNATM